MIHETTWDDPDGAALRARQRAELDARYGGDDHEPGTPPTAADIDMFLLAKDEGGAAVGCGALRALGEDVGEISGGDQAHVRRPGFPGQRGGRGDTAGAGGSGHEIPLLGSYVGSTLSRCFARSL